MKIVKCIIIYNKKCAYHIKKLQKKITYQLPPTGKYFEKWFKSFTCNSEKNLCFVFIFVFRNFKELYLLKSGHFTKIIFKQYMFNFSGSYSFQKHSVHDSLASLSDCRMLYNYDTRMDVQVGTPHVRVNLVWCGHGFDVINIALADTSTGLHFVRYVVLCNPFSC